MISLAKDLYFLARETVGCITEGFALGLKIARDESPGSDEITHGPAWRARAAELIAEHMAECGRCNPISSTDVDPYAGWDAAFRIAEGQLADALADGHYSYALDTSSVDGEAISPPVEERPAANPGIRPPVAAGHPIAEWAAIALAVGSDPARFPKLEWVAAFGLRQWMSGESCDAPTYFASIAHDLELLSK